MRDEPLRELAHLPRDRGVLRPLIGLVELLLDRGRHERRFDADESEDAAQRLGAAQAKIFGGHDVDLLAREVLDVPFELHPIAARVDVRRVRVDRLRDRAPLAADERAVLEVRAKALDRVPHDVDQTDVGQVRPDAFGHAAVLRVLRVDRRGLADGGGLRTGALELTRVPVEPSVPVALLDEEVDLLQRRHVHLRVLVEVVEQARRPALHRTDHDERGQPAIGADAHASRVVHRRPGQAWTSGGTRSAPPSASIRTVRWSRRIRSVRQADVSMGVARRGSLRIPTTACAAASWSPTGTTVPRAPIATSSRAPSTSVLTNGVPTAAAWTSTCGSPSTLLSRTMHEAERISASGSRTYPRSSTSASRPAARNPRSRTSRNGPSPATTSRARTDESSSVRWRNGISETTFFRSSRLPR